MEYIKIAPSTGSGQAGFDKLPKQNVDFGGGLERLAAATADNPDVFLIDLFDQARTALEVRSGKKYESTTEVTRSFRIILDHTRAATFMLGSGIHPSNTEQGYVLRRLLRRAIREVDRLGIKDPVLSEIAQGFGDLYQMQYPFIKESHAVISQELAAEEERFRKTLERGLKEFNWQTRTYINGQVTERELPASIVFDLATTYGFPFELVEEEALSRGLSINKQLFQNRMEAHRIQSRAGAAQKFAGGLADHQEQTIRYHTAHHLLLAALRKVLGPDVHQRGSNITAERLRIDFSYPQKITPEQLNDVEAMVNEQITKGVPVLRTEMKKEEAEKLGAEHEFGVKYPDTVSVYSVGALGNAFSIEFCGGPHVRNTAELSEGGKKKFKVQKEEAVAAGIRRIKAILV